MGHFEIYPDTAGAWRWRYRAANGKIIADSAEGYESEQDCRHGIALIKGAVNAPVHRWNAYHQRWELFAA